jgi:hypothetical protein
MIIPIARITVEDVLPMNRNKPPLAAFCAALVNWSVDISDNSWATSRNSRQARVAEDYYYSPPFQVGSRASRRRLPIAYHVWS